MITFTSLEKKVVDLLSVDGEYNKNKIEECLMKYSEDRRKSFVLFVTRVVPPEAVEETTKKMYKNLEKFDDFILDLEITNGALMFNINMNKFTKEVITTILTKGDTFGSIENKTGENILLDYSSPNIAKIFHVGHFRTTILGNFIKNLYKFNGYNPISINYLGDWGKQFGLVLLGYKKFGDPEKLKTEPLMHLFHVYVEVNKHKELQQEARDIFKAMEEDQNEEYLNQWREFRKLSIKNFVSLYDKLNVQFDVYSGESFYNVRAKEFALNCIRSIDDGDGSLVFDCGKKLGKALLLKSDGTTLYITRDIVAIKERFEEYLPKKIIYVVSSEQKLHFEQLFHIAGELGYDKSKLLHVDFGLVKGMSTREGTVHFIDDVIETAQSVFYDFVKDKNDVLDKEMTSLTLAISFLIINDFSAKRIKGYTFDIKKKATTQKGQALGPTLQYTHCRLCSILEVNKNLTAFDDISVLDNINLELLGQDSMTNGLLYKLMWFEQINIQTLKDYEPSKFVFYLQDLCGLINLAINKCRVKDEENELAKARLALFKAAQIVLHNGLIVLGLKPLTKM